MRIRNAEGRKVLRIVVCILCMAFLFQAGTQTADAQSTAKIEVSSIQAEKGELAKVTFTLSGNPGIWGLKLKVNYDQTAMTLKTMEVGSVFAQEEVVVPEKMDKAPFIFYASGDKVQDKTANGTVVTLHFLVDSSAAEKEYAVNASVEQAINVKNANVSIGVTNGKIVVMGCKHAQTEIRNAVAATAGKNGYTGDTYCKKCGVLIKKGTVIAKKATAKNFVSGKMKYKVTGVSEVAFTGLKNKNVAKVNIPKTVKYGGKKYKVTSIANKALRKNQKVRNVTVGANVKTIGLSAFQKCTKLTKVTLGVNVTKIGANAFQNCKKLSSVTIKSKKLKNVGKKCFKGIKATAKIKVPSKKLKAYKKLLNGKGQGKKVKIVK